MSPGLDDDEVFFPYNSGNRALLSSNEQINFLRVDLIPNHCGNMLIVEINGGNLLKVVIKILIKNNSVSHSHSNPILIQGVNLHAINRRLQY